MNIDMVASLFIGFNSLFSFRKTFICIYIIP